MALSYANVFAIEITGTPATFSYAGLTSVDFPVGSMGIVMVIYDNRGTNGVDSNLTISDTASNVWTQRAVNLYDPGAASAGCVVKVFTAPIVTTPSQVTLSYGVGSITCGFLGRIVSDVGAAIGFSIAGAGVGNTTITPTITTTAPTITNPQLLLGFAGKKTLGTVWTPDSDTLNGAWSGTLSQAISNTTVDSTSQISIIQSKIVTATGAQIYNPTLGATAVISNVTYVQFTEAIATVTTKRFGLLGVG